MNVNMIGSVTSIENTSILILSTIVQCKPWVVHIYISGIVKVIGSCPFQWHVGMTGKQYASSLGKELWQLWPINIFQILHTIIPNARCIIHWSACWNYSTWFTTFSLSLIITEWKNVWSLSTRLVLFWQLSNCCCIAVAALKLFSFYSSNN